MGKVNAGQVVVGGMVKMRYNGRYYEKDGRYNKFV